MLRRLSGWTEGTLTDAGMWEMWDAGRRSMART